MRSDGRGHEEGIDVNSRCARVSILGLVTGYPADPSKLTAANRAGGRLPFDAVVHEGRWS